MLVQNIVPLFQEFRTEIHGGKEAIYDYTNQKHYTYRDLHDRAKALASYLVQAIGLKKGDRIGICSENTMAFFDAYYAGMMTGIILSSYNGMLGQKSLEHFMENEKPGVLFYSKKFCKMIEAIKEKNPLDIKYIILDTERGKTDFASYNEVLAYEGEESPVYEAPKLDDIQMLIHTGGTTGIPKAAMLSYRSIYFNAVSEVLSMSLGENDSIHLMLPLFHTAAWNLFTLAILMMGGRVILTSEFHPGIALRILREEKPTCCMAIETIYKAIASHPDFEGTDFSGLRYIYSGAAPMSKSTMELYWAKGAPLTNGYGMTEAGPNNFMHPKNQLEIGWIRKKWNSIGKPIFFNEIKIVDQEGNPVPTGMAGELLMHSNLNFEGYWNQPEATAEILRDGWIHSGDIARMDEDGYCYICGRLKNMYISGGENIFPLEVEQLLGQHPAVADVCIYGVPDSYWGEVGKALIVRRPEMELTEEDLRQFIGKQVPKIRIPKYWMFVNQIPKTSVGKTDVEKAKQLYGDF